MCSGDGSVSFDDHDEFVAYLDAILDSNSDDNFNSHETLLKAGNQLKYKQILHFKINYRTQMEQKDPDEVLGQEKANLILDDRTSAWPMHRANLIPARKYLFFDSRDADESAGSKVYVFG
ncbi:hypothetical protein GH714_040789 [Hevea brasiliensis]|uniref:Uncharacterized protein n=1 Tax=Hevea brasiliensis TaxID=3981 RepID=A0A6A6MS11_HEVBR|nr:hypothetical protein GH714_040789 [Hevea brasiliensis]